MPHEPPLPSKASDSDKNAPRNQRDTNPSREVHPPLRGSPHALRVHREKVSDRAARVYPLLSRAVHVAARVETVTRAGYLAEELQGDLSIALQRLRPCEAAFAASLAALKAATEAAKADGTAITPTPKYDDGLTALTALYQRKKDLVLRIRANLARIREQDAQRFRGVGDGDREHGDGRAAEDSNDDADCSESAEDE